MSHSPPEAHKLFPSGTTTHCHRHLATGNVSPLVLLLSRGARHRRVARHHHLSLLARRRRRLLDRRREDQIDEAELRRKCANTYKLPKEYTVLCARDWAPCKPPAECSNAVCIYESMLDAGIRLPLHEFYAKVLRHYSLAPSQLCPNAWRFLAGFVLLCDGAGVAPAKAVFRHFFKLYAHGGDQQGWYYFAPYSYKRHLFKSDGGSLPSNDGWKRKFFFLDSGPVGVPWRCPKKWGTPSAAACGDPVLAEDARAVVSKLEEEAKMNEVDLMELLHESRSQRSLPVLRPPPVKAEATNAGAEFSSPPTRKRKSLAGFFVTPPPPQQTADAGTSSSPPDRGELSATQLVCQLMQEAETDLSQTKEELQEAKEQHAADVARLKLELEAAEAEAAEHKAEIVQLKLKLGAAEAEHAAEIVRLRRAAEADYAEAIVQLKRELGAAKAEHAAEVARLREKLEEEKRKHIAKIGQFAEELQAAETRHAKTVEAEQSKVRQLTEPLQARNTSAIGTARKMTELWAVQAAETEHAAKARQLTELLQAAKAEAAQLKEQLEVEKARHAREVAAIKVKCQNKVIDAKHMRSNVIGDILSERYAEGLRDMRDLVLELYPGAVDASRLTPAALASSVPPGFHPRDRKAPADQ
jgi:hypothetical protein